MNPSPRVPAKSLSLVLGRLGLGRRPCGSQARIPKESPVPRPSSPGKVEGSTFPSFSLDGLHVEAAPQLWRSREPQTAGNSRPLGPARWLSSSWAGGLSRRTFPSQVRQPHSPRPGQAHLRGASLGRPALAGAFPPFRNRVSSSSGRVALFLPKPAARCRPGAPRLRVCVRPRPATPCCAQALCLLGSLAPSLCSGNESEFGPPTVGGGTVGGTRRGPPWHRGCDDPTYSSSSFKLQSLTWPCSRPSVGTVSRSVTVEVFLPLSPCI